MDKGEVKKTDEGNGGNKAGFGEGEEIDVVDRLEKTGGTGDLDKVGTGGGEVVGADAKDGMMGDHF